MAGLPDFVEPMLARLGREAFDSAEHRFEVKWDGTRSQCRVAGGEHRLRNRRGADQTARYPELDFLAALPDPSGGLILDGEIVVLRDGLPDFRGMLRREQARDPVTARARAAELPAVYVAFDLLYREGKPLLERPLAERVEELRELVERVGQARLVFSEGVVGEGRAFFEGIRARGLEGMLAKRLTSPYLPGRRSDAWLKVKPVQTVHCLVLGWERDRQDGVKSLVVAIEEDGRLRCVGQVGSGLDEATRARLRAELPRRARPARAGPLVPCPGIPDAKREWIEPGLFCTVSYLERTRDGNLRAPVFRDLFEDERWSPNEPAPDPLTDPPDPPESESAS